MAYAEKVAIIRDNAGVSGVMSTVLATYTSVQSPETPTAMVGQLDFNWPTSDTLSYSFSIMLVTSTEVIIGYSVPPNSSISTCQVWLSVIDSSWTTVLYILTNLQHAATSSISSGQGVRCDTNFVDFSTGLGSLVTNETSGLKVFVLMQGVDMYRSPKPFFNITTEATIANNTHYCLKVCTSQSTVIHSYFYGRIIFNETVNETAHIFLNSYSLAATDTSDWSAIERSYHNLFNVILGVSSYSFSGTWNWFDTSPTDSRVTGSSTGINFIEKFQFEPLTYSCPVGYPYLHIATMHCYDICPEGTHPSIGWCVKCPTGCLSCNENVCLSCDSQFTLNAGKCECLGGSYLSESVCKLCPYSCTMCSSAEVCTSCDTINNFTMVGVMCICNIATNYVLNGTSCKLCSEILSMCVSCSSNNTCTQCSSIPLLSLNEINQCECALGFYLDADSSLCLACNLLGCLNCSSLVVCVGCNQDFVLSSSSCICAGNLTLVDGICSCMAGQYRAGQSCIACSPYCENCTNSTSDACSSCMPPKKLQAGTCLCPQRTYMSSDSPFTCLPCHYSCFNCTAGSSFSCINCEPASNRELYDGTCFCRLSTYDSGQLACFSCKQTLPGCEHCASSTYCQVCTPASTLLQGRCVCPSGQFVNITGCFPCASAILGCVECSSSTACILCNKSINLQLTSDGFCGCSAGYELTKEGQCKLLQIINQVQYAAYITKGLVIGGYSLFLVTHFIPGAFVSLEFMHCLQTVYFSSTHFRSEALQPLASLDSTTGYVYSSDHDRRIMEENSFTPKEFVQQFNVMLALQLLIVATGYILFLVSHWRPPLATSRQQTIKIISKTLLGDMLYKWTQLTAMGYSFAVASYFVNLGGQSFGSYLGNFVCIALEFMLVALAFYNAYRKHLSSQLTEGLKEETNLLQYYPVSFLLYRLVFGFAVGLLSGTQYCVFFALVLQLIYITFNYKRNLFTKSEMTLQKMSCEIGSLCFIVYLVLCYFSPANADHLAWMWIIVLLPATCGAFTLRCIINHQRIYGVVSSQSTLTDSDGKLNNQIELKEASDLLKQKIRNPTSSRPYILMGIASDSSEGPSSASIEGDKPI